MASSFLRPGSLTEEGQFASLQLSRDSSVPVRLSTVATTVEEQGYAEGVVTNTKFGSFPHTTLLGIPWGSQVRASKVDTGTRGRKDIRNSKKRKADAIDVDSPSTDIGSPAVKEAALASSGFAHVLPPTPENWTTSLPHRTQVVYTPDYSYILHRIRARPGSVLIEAGSGSGSFTHAAARAVFDGATEPVYAINHSERIEPNQRPGRVFTYEFHRERHRKVLDEMCAHRLNDIVHATHRDVYKDGFLIEDASSRARISPNANAIFLDLPAPWEALPHLTRASRPGPDGELLPSALDPSKSVYISTFSPCIEQVQKTISTLRRLGWLEIEMVEIQHRRIDVRRDFTGLQYDGLRSVNAYPETVEEAVAKLKEDEERLAAAHAGIKLPTTNKQARKMESRSNDGKQQDAAKLLYTDGRIVHRSEPELKTHTSYLIFAVLPRDWTDEDERAARDTFEASVQQAFPVVKSQRQMKREANLKKREKQARKQEVDAGKVEQNIASVSQ